MTPTLPEILRGEAIALSTPLPPEAGGDYAAGRMGMISTLAVLAAQEADRGPAARIWENGVIRAMLGQAAGAYDAGLNGALAKAAVQTDTDFTWTGLDTANAALRRLLIALHEAVEAAGDQATDRAIIDLYGRMAHERRLDLG